MIKFSADEVFEMAEQMERNGAAYYRKAAESAAGKDAADFLLGLASMEVEHERTFQQMRSELAGHERAEAQFDPDGQGAQYLRSVVEGKVFDFDSAPAEQLTGSESLADVLRVAIDLEKDSIVFYHLMKPMVPAEGGRDRLDDIIEQEVGHIAVLSRQLGSLG